MLNLRSSIVSEFAAILPNPTHSVTLSFKSRWLPKNKTDKLNVATGACKWFSHVLSDRCFRRGSRRDQKRVGCIAVAEGMSPDKRVHLHLAFRCPTKMAPTQFTSLLKASAQKTRDLGNIDIQAYYDGWYDYITKEHDHEVLWEICNAGTDQ